MGRKSILESSFQDLLIKYKNGDIEARNKIIEYYMKSVLKIAEKYFDLGLDNEDVISAAYEGLVMEIVRIKDKDYSNPSKSIQERVESSIRGAIINYYGFNEEKGMTSNKFKSSLIKVLCARRDLSRVNGCRVSIKQISQYLMMDINEVKYFLQFLSKVSYTEFSNAPFYLENVDPYKVVICDDLKSIIYRIIRLENFTEFERLIIEKRYLSNNPLTLRDLAKMLGCSANNILKTERRAFRKIGNSSYFVDYIHDYKDNNSLVLNVK